MRIDVDSESNRRRGPAGRLAASAVVLLFILAVVVTGMVSLGAYCLTTDGGNLRLLAGADRRPGGNGIQGASCALPAAGPAAHPPGGDSMSAVKPRSSIRPPIDVEPHPELETATFALG